MDSFGDVIQDPDNFLDIFQDQKMDLTLVSLLKEITYLLFKTATT